MATTLTIIGIYLGLLLCLGLFSGKLFRGTSKDYFVASHSIGPFMLLMSIFGTTMTAFALVGSTGKAYMKGIGVYGLMASWSGLIHSAVFFIVGIKVWQLGKKHGFVTQCQYFKERFESKSLGYFLFPILVILVIPYLLLGLIGAGRVIAGLTRGQFVETFPNPEVALLHGAIPPWLTGLIISSIVLIYIFFGGLRGAAWANTFQTIVFMCMGMLAFYLIAKKLGGPIEASQNVLNVNPKHLSREGMIPQLEFLTYCFVPLSVGMFPHLFQHWLTAKNAKSFKLTVVAHPICIMIVWIPCILIGIWAAGLNVPKHIPAPAILGYMVSLLDDPVFSGLITAGILAAIMSSLDSQFMCLGTMFTNDILTPIMGKNKLSDKQLILFARIFIVIIVSITYALSLINASAYVFKLGIWCFSGFASLFPLIIAALYWKGATKAGFISALMATTLLWFYFFSLSNFGKDKEELLIMGAMPVTFLVLTNAFVLVAVSLMTAKPSEETLNKFFEKA